MAITTVMPDTTLPLDFEARETADVVEIDEESFRAFYERTARPVWAYLTRITGDSHLAEDLLQEAYYRFCRASAVYESETHRRNALFRIATNLARDSGRRNRRAVHVAIPDDLEAIVGRPE